MTRKNSHDPERETAQAALFELVNLPRLKFDLSRPDDDIRQPELIGAAFRRAGKFIERYGHLRPKSEPTWITSDKPAAALDLPRTDGQIDESRWRIASYPSGTSDSLWAEIEVFEYARRFREIWQL